MKNAKKVDTLATVLTFVGFAISGVSLLVTQRQAKLHRQQDVESITNEVLKQIEKKK